MSSNGSTRGRPSYVRKPKQVRSRLACGPSEPGDELVGSYTVERLLEMDQRFCERIERAFETGAESREAAAAMHGANASHSR
jgi:hypothetical protein